MTAFTRLGSSIWDWDRWTELEASPRILWLALYTSGEAKRHVPGLWQGSFSSMADAGRMRVDDVVNALDALLDRELVEYDAKLRVLRLCELPDCGEYPSNGRVILGWWTKFNTVPPCAVRDAHVRTLQWICQEGSRRSGKTFTPNHQEAWNDTFARIVIPAPRRRGVRRLADNNDTGTSVQPSLFSPPVSPVLHESSYPQNPQIPVYNSAVLRQLNEINVPETVSHTVSDTVSHTNRIRDPGSRIPDHSSLSGEGDWGRGDGERRVLTLVPPATPYTADDVIRALAVGPWDSSFDQSHQNAIGALIPLWVTKGRGLSDFARLADYNRHSGRVWSARVLAGCDLDRELDTANKALNWRDAQAAMMLNNL
jgi:hypothetical protein